MVRKGFSRWLCGVAYMQKRAAPKGGSFRFAFIQLSDDQRSSSSSSSFFLRFSAAKHRPIAAISSTELITTLAPVPGLPLLVAVVVVLVVVVVAVALLEELSFAEESLAELSFTGVGLDESPFEESSGLLLSESGVVSPPLESSSRSGVRLLLSSSAGRELSS